MTDRPPIAVILIEDHGIVREGLKLILHATTDVAVVGEAGDGRAGVALFRRLVVEEPAGDGPPVVDVVVTDVGLPDMSGLEVVRRIRALQPAARVLVLTMHADDDYIFGMLDAGAAGYLLKQSAARELPDAVRTVARGETFLSPDVLQRVVQRAQDPRRRHLRPLSKREQQVLHLLAQGTTSKEVGRQLSLSIKTVESHRANILDKLGVSNTAAAIMLAYQQGLLPALPPGPAETTYPKELP